MAEAFQEAGFYEGTYEAEGAEGQPAEEQAQEGEPAAEADAGQGEASDDTLEGIVEDLKRKNNGE
jgi:hypothetical protein